MTPLDLIALALATFYLAYVISSTHGPWHLFVWSRARLPFLACLYCVSMWAGVLFYLLLAISAGWIVYMFAAAGASAFLYRYSGGPHV